MSTTALLKHRGYILGSPIGEGITGKVYSLIPLKPISSFHSNNKEETSNNNEKLAIKVISMNFVENNILEIDTIARLSHPNIINLKELINIDNNRVALVTPLISATLNSYPAMDKPTQISIMYQCAHGLSYLHENGILHLDFKLDNILYSPQTGVKIIDFGSAIMIPDKQLQRHVSSPVVAGIVRPPEISSTGGGTISYYTDVWSYGISMFCLIGKVSVDALISMVANATNTALCNENIYKHFGKYKMQTLTSYISDTDIVGFLNDVIQYCDYDRKLMSDICSHSLFAANDDVTKDMAKLNLQSNTIPTQNLGVGNNRPIKYPSYTQEFNNNFKKVLHDMIAMLKDHFRQDEDFILCCRYVSSYISYIRECSF